MGDVESNGSLSMENYGKLAQYLDFSNSTESMSNLTRGSHDTSGSNSIISQAIIIFATAVTFLAIVFTVCYAFGSKCKKDTHLSELEELELQTRHDKTSKETQKNQGSDNWSAPSTRLIQPFHEATSSGMVKVLPTQHTK